MTPLAHRILANQLKPVKDRLQVKDDGGFLRDMASVVCFEMSEIVKFVEWQAGKLMRSKAPWPISFLPAERTWLEWTDETGTRVAVLFAASNGHLNHFDIAYIGPDRGLLAAKIMGRYNPAMSLPDMVRIPKTHDEAVASLQTRHAIMLLLAAINAPKVFARVEHNPHAGLARKMAASKAMPGKYPLHAWHEIKLEGWMPKVEHGTRRAKGATGEKAQHFVRAHPRFQNGKWVIVKWHRRGNPELGMRRARYSVQMPNSTA